MGGGSTIEGMVKDAVTGEVLPGANVIVVGTSIGAATDVNGKYVLRNVPAGSYSIRATYVGYRTVELKIVVVEETAGKQDFSLVPVGVEGFPFKPGMVTTSGVAGCGRPAAL